MAKGQYNAKSDVPAKQAFVKHLLTQRNFDEARVTRRPADITAMKNQEVFYFEIKYTAQTATYFGAATLTEWEAALENESNFWFVTATLNGGVWAFREYSPSEFMAFSYIPPFKVFFSVPVGIDLSSKKGIARRPDGFVSSRIPMTRERLSTMVDMYKGFRSELS